MSDILSTGRFDLNWIKFEQLGRKISGFALASLFPKPVEKGGQE